MADILIAQNMMPHIIAALEAKHTLHRLFDASDPTAFLQDIADRVAGMATMGRADAALIDALPKLEIISSFGVGYDGVDAAHAAASDIVVTNTPDVLNDEVSNTAVMLVLACARNLVLYDRYVRDGQWELKGDPPLTSGINGKIVGILGLGRIGKEIARKLEAFGCTIVYSGRTQQDNVACRFYADLTDMARDANYLIAICPGGEATRGIVNADVLAALGPDGTFINVARGSVHDEDALIEALRTGKLGKAGLDVFVNEPKVPRALREMDNVLLQPHQGSATVETRRAMGDLVADNLLAWFDGKPPLTPVAECAELADRLRP